MELLVFLIVIGLIVGFILGIAGFFTAQAAGRKVARLESQINQLGIELSDARALTLRLYERQYAVEGQPLATEGMVESLSDETTSEPEEQPIAEERAPVEVVRDIEEESVTEEPAIVESEASSPVEEPPAVEEPVTLQHLLELQQQKRQEEETRQVQEEQPEQPEDGPVDEGTEKAVDEAPQHVTAEKAAVEVNETLASDVTTRAPEEPYASEEAPARRLTIEEVLAGKVFVWIGAIALVLTGAFLLKIGFTEGIIKPVHCVMLAGVLGLAMWGVGEWMHRRVSLIAQALCGAAVAVLYGTILAAQHYDLLGNGSAAAFALMASVTAAAVVLSLRHGPAVAILGMLGGFMMPPLLTQNLSPTLGMVLYLIAIEVGVLAVTGKRGWFGISLMTLIFSVTWSIGYTIIGDNPQEHLLTAMLVLGTAGAYIFHTARIHRDPAADARTKLRVLGLSIAATCSALGVVAILAVKGQYDFQDLAMLGVVALGTLILARLDPRQIAMPFVAMAISFLVLLSHVVQTIHDPLSSELIGMAAGFGGLFLLGGYVCMWGSQHRRTFALMSAIAGPAFYGLVFFAGHEQLGLRGAWWPYTLGLTGLYAVATLPMLLRRKAEHDWPIALFSVLSFVLVCITLGQSLDHPYFAVSLALVSAAAALIDLRLFIRPLRLAGCVAAFVSAGLLVAPGPFDLAIHGVPVFNTLLWMYLIPAIAFGVIAWSAARAGSKATAQNLAWLSMATLGAMLLALTRDIFQPVDFNTMAFELYEWSTYAAVLLLAGFVSQWAARRFSYEPILHGTRVLVGLGGILALVAGLVSSNPLFHQDAEGGLTLAAGLLALYAAPAALLWLWSRRQTIAAVPQLAESLRAVSVTLVALFVTLQIRNGFQGADFHGAEPGMFECIAYAVAWIMLGGLMQWYNQGNLQSMVTRVAGRLIFAAGLLTTVMASVIVFNPLLTSDATGGWDLAARMLVLYALPAALLWAWSRSKTLADQPIMSAALRGSSIALFALFVGLQIRNGFQSENLQTQTVSLYECIAYMVAGLMLGGLIQLLNQRYLRDAVTEVAGQIIFGIGFAVTLIGGVVVFNPIVDQTAEGGWALSGQMAVLYLLPAVLMWLWSRGKTLADQPWLINTLRGTAIAYLPLFVGILIRNAYQHDDLHALTVGLFECTTYGLAWAGLGYLFYAIAPRCTLPQATGRVGRSLFGIGLATLLLGNVLVLNPLWFPETVGTTAVFNGLWYVYGPLILLLALLARHARKHQMVIQAKLAGFLAVGLSFMLLSMFVRHGFSGDGFVLIKNNLIPAERYAYSLAWVVFGAALLVAGVFTRLDTLRYGSLAVLLLAIGKVFLIDTANLENLYRVFSYFGLGVTLVGLGYLYQRLVFKRPAITNKAQAA